MAERADPMFRGILLGPVYGDGQLVRMFLILQQAGAGIGRNVILQEKPEKEVHQLRVQVDGQLRRAREERRDMAVRSDPEQQQVEDDSGQLELVNLEGGGVGRATFKPGWQWSKHIKPIAGTESCQASHVG